MKSICYVFGTRPEVIRSAGILREFSRSSRVQVYTVNTGQHFDPPMMSKLAREVGLPEPAHTLPVRHDSPGRRVAGMIGDLVELFEEGKFDAVVVYGDTDSSLAGALASIKTRVPVIHVEAGCRSGDMRMQEELNRRLIDHMSSLHLAVSEVCASNLESEAVVGQIVVTGDPQYDVFWAHKPVSLPSALSEATGFVTLHRAENVDDPYFLESVIGALEQIGSITGVKFTWAAHPRTASFFAQSSVASAWITVTPPLSYGLTLAHLAKASVCVTDSGGLQKEAFWLRTPCVTMRDTTEWVETVQARANYLCPNPARLLDVVSEALASGASACWDPDPYGGVGSSGRVVAAITEWLWR